MLIKSGISILDIETRENKWASGGLASVHVSIAVHIPSIADEDGYSPPEYASVCIRHDQKDNLKKVINELNCALEKMDQVVSK